ncbi:RES family NAD+ phosphorylase [Gloeocapsa sp. PCC 73106]|uniref:RES family NAD+ phosphorylase n=1 Tax=Gloeocapsa sp. PCC 73106 TaxID=102232 RepID=UPI0002AD0BE6|nr:RES family NAD+ phosphorylase [Gloeocapsa sp. PCC 73106]ELR97029.1 RES domain-containing protein [Gloeocapsa sp. PCC 73106]
MVNKSQPKDPLPEHPAPPGDFSTRTLPIFESSGPWYRLNPVQYSSALYFDRSGKGRFDGPIQGYGILYLGEDEYASFIESYGRVHGARGVAEAALRQRNLFTLSCDHPLILVDLTGSSLVKLGADARLSSGSYAIARTWVRAIWEHPMQVDGVRYRSRHDDDRFCCGLFDRVAPHLRESNLGNLIDAHPLLLSEILKRYNYGLL